MRALHFGAGNIGRGFIGQLLHESGYEITFVDVRDDLVEALKREARYEVALAEEAERKIPVGPVSALHAENEEKEIARSIAKADLVTTSVGPSVLPALAPVLAEGLVERARVGGSLVNVIACENMVGASQALRASVMERVPGEQKEAVEKIAGFPNAAVDRIVPEQSERGLDVLVEPFFEWVVDASQVEGELPAIPDVTYVRDLSPYIERKLLTVNTGHCAAAYLGYAHGSPTVQAALDAGHIREAVAGALEETGILLAAEHLGNQVIQRADGHHGNPAEGAGVYVTDGPVGVVGQGVDGLDGHHRAFEGGHAVEGQRNHQEAQDRVAA